MKLSTFSLLSLMGSAAAFSPSTFGISNSYRNTKLHARKPIISGNWKLNPQTKSEAIELASAIAKSVGPDTPDCEVALFVPYVFIESVNGVVDGKINVGAEVGFFVIIFAYFEFLPIWSCMENTF